MAAFLIAVALLAALLPVACGPGDSELRTSVLAQLAVDAATTQLDLQVTVDRRIVYLSGETATRQEQRTAVERARSVPGVENVVDSLRLSDRSIEQAVRQALSGDSILGRISIDVQSNRGVVRLSSDATNAEERMRAVAVATSVDGVRTVEDDMR